MVGKTIAISLMCILACATSQFAYGQNAQQYQQKRQLAMVVPLLDVNAVKQAAYLDFTNQRFEVALEKYKEVARATGATAPDLYWLGETYFHLRQYDRAADSFDQASPSYEEARVRLVETYLAARQFDKANSVCSAKLAMANSPQTVARLKTLQKVLSMRSLPVPKRNGGKAEK